MIPHAFFSLPENGIIDPERPSAPSQRLHTVSARNLLSSFFSLGGIYAIVAPSLWRAAGRITIPREESSYFSVQPVVKGIATYKTQFAEEGGNAGATSSHGSVPNNGLTLLLRLKVKSESCSVMSDPLRPQGIYCAWDSPGQSTGLDSRSLFQGIFLTQESNQGLLHWRRILYQFSYWGEAHLTDYHHPLNWQHQDLYYSSGLYYQDFLTWLLNNPGVLGHNGSGLANLPKESQRNHTGTLN